MTDITCTRTAFLRIGGLAAAAGLALACGALPARAEEGPSDKQAGESSGGAPATLVIGHEGNTVEVACEAELTPAGLIDALARETGWNLALADVPEIDGDLGTVTVAFAQDSAIYTEPPERQNDDYHVFDSHDLIYTVLNSVARTLYENLNCGVCFSAPDGGPIELSNGCYDFYLSDQCPWNEYWVEATNQPLPDDSIGLVYLTPNGTNLAGWQTMALMFMRDTVETGAGRITIEDSDGNVFASIDVADSERVVPQEVTESELGMLNYRSCSAFTILLDEPLKPNATYGVAVDAGAFASGDIAIREISPDDWRIETLGFGTGATDIPLVGTMSVGTAYTTEYLLDESVRRVTVVPSEPNIAEFSTDELTETGTLTVTPQKEGVLSFTVTFEPVEGDPLAILYSYEVVAG